MDCKGLMQVHPAVEIDMGAQGDIFDPRTNIMTGTRLLRWLANRVDGDLVLTIAGYHAGLGSLAKFGYTVPPYSYTRQYLKMVLERYYQYKTEEQRAQALGR
jgi:soluble lytic murein transglycosylase-like protein